MGEKLGVPKVTVEYNLPDEDEVFELSCQAEAMMFMVRDLLEEARRMTKYPDGHHVEVVRAWELLRTTLWDAIDEWGLRNVFDK